MKLISVPADAFRGRGLIPLVVMLLRYIGRHAIPTGVAAYTKINKLLMRLRGKLLSVTQFLELRECT